MKTRPVFESFDQFIDFLDDFGIDDNMVNEANGITIEEFSSKLSSFFDKEAKSGFLGYRKVIAGSPFYTSKKGASVLDNTKVSLANLAKRIENRQNDEDKGKGTIEYFGTGIDKIEIDQMVSGKIKIVKVPGGSVSEIKNNDWNTLEDVLAQVNKDNFSGNSSYFPYLNKKGNAWTLSKDDKDYISLAGSVDNVVISDITTGVNFVKIPLDGKVAMYDDTNAAKFMPVNNFLQPFVKKQRKGKVGKVIIFYTIDKVIEGAGDEIPTEYIVKVFSTTVLPGEIVDLSRILKGTDKMFEQGKSTLLKGKENDTKKAIDQLLGEFTAIESIVITGGASFEGGLELNKKLVVERATTTKNLIETMHPELKGKVSVNETDFSKIQSTDDPKTYEQFRKIYLQVKGNVKGNEKQIKEEKEVIVGGKIKFDKVILNQYTLGFEFGIK